MADPIADVKYRIQSVDFQTYLETSDAFPANNIADVRLRVIKETDRQYWKLEKAGTGYYIRNVANNNQRLYLDTNAHQCRGSTTGNSLVNVTYYGDGAYRLAIYDSTSSTNYYLFPSASDGTVNATSVISSLDAQKWQLVPVTPQPINNYLLRTGTYRIRNLDATSILTMPSDTVTTKGVYVRSNNKSPYQSWAVTLQPSGTYAIQNAGNNLYLGCGAKVPASGNTLVGLQNPLNWDIQSVGGFACSLRIPTAELSVGFADYEVNKDTEVSLVTSDATFSQIWLMEKFGINIQASRRVTEGKYLVQNSAYNTVYMNVNSTPYYYITSGSAKTSQFELKYIDQNSPLFTLTYVTKSTPPPIVADVGGNLGLSSIGTQFVLLEQNEGDKKYSICRPDSGQVVTGISRPDINGKTVFPFGENQYKAWQLWNLVPVTK